MTEPLENSGNGNNVNVDVDVRKRRFLKGLAVAGLSLGVLGGYSPVLKRMFDTWTGNWTKVVPNLTEVDNRVTLVRTVCLQCHGACGIQARVVDRDSDAPVAIKIDGNPYHPNTKVPHLNFETGLDTAKLQAGHICAKGQAGIETLYDPKRVTGPLKRVGKRGENKWEPITWEQAFKEIIEGGTLPGPNGGTYKFVGLKDLAANDDPIDPTKPWYGRKANHILFSVGRSEHGRKELSDRIFGYVFGTVNYRIDHTSICEQSHHIAFKYSTAAGKTHMKPDFENAKFVITFGGSYLEANFPFTALADRVMKFKRRGGRLAVVDPRYSNTAKHAEYWLPVIPGTDAALALGIARVLFEENLIDENFLKRPNQAAANKVGEYNWSDATKLVNVDTHEYVKVQDIDPTQPTNENHVVYVGAGNGSFGPNNEFEDATVVDEAELFPSGDAGANPMQIPAAAGGTINAKTALELYRDEAYSKTLDEWASICGIDAETIREVAIEFGNAGKKAVADFYRGPVQHTNGFYNGRSIIMLNFLVGNLDWRGGLSKGGSHWDELGKKSATAPYPGIKTLNTAINPKSYTYNNVSYTPWKVTREGVTWDENNPEWNMYTNNEPPRPFYPLTSNVWQEMFGAIETAYPYPILQFWNHMGNPNYSIPGSAKVQEVMTMPMTDDTKKKLADEGFDLGSDPYQLPLIVSIDVVVGEGSAYADYILPDVTFLERFGTPHIAPTIQTKLSHVRQPVFGKYIVETGNYIYRMRPDLDDGVYQWDDQGNLTFDLTRRGNMNAEDMYILLGRLLKGETDGINMSVSINVPDSVKNKIQGVGIDAFGAGMHLRHAWDWYKGLILNLVDHYEADTGNTIPGNNVNEKIQYVLDRGGLFENADEAYDGKYLKHKHKKECYFWSEKVATKKHPYTKELFWGGARYEPIKDMKGTEVQSQDKQDGYDFYMITYKMPIHTQSRTMANPLLVELLPENYIEISEEDANRLNLKNGDMVKVTSPTNTEGIIGKIFIRKGLRPGVIAFAHSYGHTQYGGSDWYEGGKRIEGDKRRLAGITLNPIMRLDTSYGLGQNQLLGAISLTDPIGGSASFYDTMVKIEKVST